MEKKLPANWIYIKLGDLSTIQSGGTPARGKAQYWNGKIPWVKISDIKSLFVNNVSEYITDEGLNNSSAKIFEKGTVLFTIFASIGKVGILGIDAATNQAIVGITPLKEISSKYLTYSLIDLSNSLIEKGKGIAQKNINLTILKNTLIPLAPFNEQTRIANKLDQLFSHLDKLKARLDTIPKLLKQFRQAVLTQAVTGKLTEEWREERELKKMNLKDVQSAIIRFEYSLEDTIPDSWLLLKAESVTSKITDGEHQTPKRVDEGEMLLSAKNVRSGYVDYENFDRISEEDFIRCLKRCKAEKGDVLIVSVGATIGRTAIVRENKAFALVRSVGLLKPNKNIIAHYLMYVLQSSELQNVINKVSRGSAQACLYINKMKGLPIPLPPKAEQIEIVERVANFFTTADKIEAQYKILKEQIDNLPQTILAKAFRGELVEQYPEDEPAELLLERIKAEREKAGKQYAKPFQKRMSRAAEGKASYKSP